MKNYRTLSEIETRYGTRNINELEFDSPEEFAAYKKKHKLRKGTVVKVAGKDKKIGGDDKPEVTPGKTSSIETVDFVTFNPKEIKKFAEKHGIKASKVQMGPNGYVADFSGDPEKIKAALTSDDYGMEPDDFDEIYGDSIKDNMRGPGSEEPEEPQIPEAPVSGEPKVDKSEMEDIFMNSTKDAGFGEQDTSELSDIVYTYEDDLEEAGVLDDVQDDLYIVQYINSDDPSNPEDIPMEERERAIDRLRRNFEKADIIAESVNNIRQLSKITTRYSK
tara:strand:+ start:98 stop:925 length:828 start_codon:yes stop_codon:yes gene_type:complete